MRRVLALLPLAAAAALAAPAARSDTAPRLRARAQHVLGQVDALDRQIERIAEAYDLAGVDLARTQRDLGVDARALAVAHRNLSRARADLDRLLVARYKSGDADSTLAVVLGATSMTDLIGRLEATEQIGKEETRIIGQVRRFQTQVAAERRRLLRERADKKALRRSLSTRRAEIGRRLDERRRLLASIRGELARLEAQERALQRRRRREADLRLAAQSAPQVAQVVLDAAPSAGEQGAAAPGGHPEVVAIALRYLGIPYRWGGASPAAGFDCSGFVLYVYAQIGVALPHNAALQYGYGKPVARSELQPGDLVFFSGLGHDGIYIGGGQFVDAPRTGDVVKIENLDDAGWSASYVGARRLP